VYYFFNEFYFCSKKLRATIIKNIENQKVKASFLYLIKKKTESFTETLFATLFDKSVDVNEYMNILELEFKSLADLVCKKEFDPCRNRWTEYMDKLPKVLEDLNKDAKFILENDPAAATLEEVYLAYPGFYAIAIYRLSHLLTEFELPLVPRLMTESAHSKTGTDINPKAKIGVPFFIDHATGVVIGETTVIKNNVKIYQGVTLGALLVDKSMQHIKRHPTIKDNVTIYANATILGGDTEIGENSVIGGNVWLTKSVPKNSIVSYQSSVKIQEKNKTYVR